MWTVVKTPTPGGRHVSTTLPVRLFRRTVGHTPTAAHSVLKAQLSAEVVLTSGSGCVSTPKKTGASRRCMANHSMRHLCFPMADPFRVLRSQRSEDGRQDCDEPFGRAVSYEATLDPDLDAAAGRRTD
jgi:hypothetical protein